jgi:hypothetical protein
VLAVALAGTVFFGSALAVIALDRPLAERVAERLLAAQIRRDLASDRGGDPGAALDRLARTLPPGTRALKVLRPERLGRTSRAELARSPAYEKLLDQLLDEARRFSLWNLGLFAATALLAAWRPPRSPYLLMPAAILTGATCLAAASYFLAEDWLFAFLTGGYAVYGYLVIWGAAAALLADVAFNRTRISALLARVFWHWQP